MKLYLQWSVATIAIVILSACGSNISVNDGNTKSAATSINPNSTTAGNIDSAGDEDWFKVVIPHDGTLVVETTGATDTYGYLLDASNREIASNDDGGLNRNFKISKSVTAGTYYVKVKHRDPSESMGAYSLVAHFDDHGNSKDGATPINNPNSRTSGRIETAGDVDWFKIVIPSGGGTLIVSTAGSTDTNGSLYRANNDLNASDDNGGTGNNFKITQTVTAGTYYVKVSASSTGDYWLDSQFTPSATEQAQGSLSDNDNNVSTATLINVTTTTEPIKTTGHIDVAGDNDYFKIVIPSAGRLIVRTEGTTDTYGYLLDSNGEELASNDNSGFFPKNFKIVKYITAGTAGTYYVRIRGSSSDVTGAYTFVAQFESGITEGSDDHSNSIVGATPINPNSTTQGRINVGQDEDYFKVVVPEAGTLIVTTATDVDDAMDTYGYLYDENGNALTSNNNHKNSYDLGTSDFKIFRSVTAGTYYVMVKDRSRSKTGDYTLLSHFVPGQTQQAQGSDDHNNTKDGATSIDLNSTTSGSIETAGDVDWFKIVIPSRGGVLTVSTTGTIDTEGYLYDENGNQLEFNDDGLFPNFGISKSLTAGTYYVKVDGFNSNVIGNYSLVTRFTPDQ
ncbi:MAG: PPC domain-containing protein [Sulfurovum sp.]|nr:PPC domain-containing protein [Sulfurovum sp.]